MNTNFETDLVGAIFLVRRTQLHCTLVPSLQHDCANGLVGRIRGAWGNAIAARAKAGDSDAAQLLSAFFGTEDHHLRPWVIRTSQRNLTIELELSILGSAIIWQELAFETLLTSLTAGAGLKHTSAKESGSSQLRLVDAHWRRHEAFVPGNLSSEYRLALTTPLYLARKGALISDCSTFLESIARRVCGLASWFGCNVRDPTGAEKLAVSEGLPDVSTLTPDFVLRNSRRRSRKHHHVGLVGDLFLSELRPIQSLLIQVGEIVGVGSEVSLGMGQYTIIK